MFQGLQRIGGAINARLAEEQARQKAAQQASASRSDSAPRRSNSRTLSPSKRPTKAKNGEDSKALPSGKGPDPSEFDPDFIVGEEDDAPSRAATPRPKDKPLPSKPTSEDGEAKQEDKQASETEENSKAEPELSPEVQSRLRKLDKLEPKYTELLRSYRIAHARIGAIEVFETSLREHTPLMSISDASAFVEYLGQLNVKSDMLMEELKRVSKEKDEFKKKAEEAVKQSKEAADELAKLKSLEGSETNVTSPDSKPTEKSLPASSAKDGVEFSSYDRELPRLQSQLQEREEKIESLEAEKSSLRDELSTAQESAHSFMRNLETTANDLNTFKDTHQKLQREAAERENEQETIIEELKSKVESAEQVSLKHQENLDRDTRIIAKLEEKLATTTKELEDLHAEKGESLVDDDQIQTLQTQVKNLEAELAELQNTYAQGEKRNETMNGLLSSLREQLKSMEGKRDSAIADLEQMKKELVTKFKDVEIVPVPSPSEPQIAPTTPMESASSKKRNRKKKKGGKEPDTVEGVISEATPIAAGNVGGLLTSRDAGLPSSPTEDTIEIVSQLKTELEVKIAAIEKLESEIKDKASSIEFLKRKVKEQDDLQEEIDTLRQDLLDFGAEHTEAKDDVKRLLAEKAALQDKITNLEKEITEFKSNKASHEASRQAQFTLVAEFEELKAKAGSLQTDLSAAEKLAASRFKDLTDLRDVLQKAQPELSSLRKEVVDLRSTKEELSSKTSEVRKLEGREKDLKIDIANFRSRLSDKESEIRTLSDKIKQENTQRSALEETSRKIQKDLQRSEVERKDVVETRDKLNKDLLKAQEDVKTSRTKIHDLEDEVSKLKREAGSLRDDLQLKSAQYASAQDLMNSMQDQTQEISTQMKEIRSRSESLEEELADAHRLLSERGREAETMRRLLNDAQGRADARVREMQERLDVAVEERERAEEQASNFGRRRARELEELKQKVRDAERAMTRAIEDKDDLASVEKELRKQKDEVEKRAAHATEEATEVRSAMGQLRDALDESEKQTRLLDKEKSDLRRAFDETQSRLEKLQKSSKTMSEELRSMKTRGGDSNAQSSRTSIDSSRSRLASPAPRGGPPPAQAGEGIDYVYLKNVLLQFLEQKDKKYQQQLIPVLGMILHFDKTEETKWMAAISAK